MFLPNETSMREIEGYPVEQFEMKERVSVHITGIHIMQNSASPLLQFFQIAHGIRIFSHQ